MIVRIITTLPFISVPIVDKVKFNIENNFSEQCKTPVEMIYIDKRVLAEILYRYIYTVTL